MLLGKGVEGFRVWGRGWYQCLINVLQWFLEGSGFHGWGSSLQFKLIRHCSGLTYQTLLFLVVL